MIFLKQSTAATLRVGPFMDAGDGVTPETGVDLATADQAELLKHSGATVDISGATWAAITGVGGWYDLSLTTSHTDTLGMLTVVVQDSSLCTPVFVRAMVVPANVYDSLVAGSDLLQADVQQLVGTTAALTQFGIASIGVLDAGAAGGFTLPSGQRLQVSAGMAIWVPGKGSARIISAGYNSGSGVGTVDSNFDTAAAGSDPYIVFMVPAPVTTPPEVDVVKVDGVAVDPALPQVGANIVQAAGNDLDGTSTPVGLA